MDSGDRRCGLEGDDWLVGGVGLELSFLVITLAVMTGPEDGELNLCEYVEGDASGKKYGESEVEGAGDCAGELAGNWFFGRPDEGDCGAMKLRNLLERKQPKI